jgi:hypothetical protein
MQRFEVKGAAPEIESRPIGDRSSKPLLTQVLMASSSELP